MAGEEENERTAMQKSVGKMVESAGEHKENDSAAEECEESESCAGSTSTKETEEVEEKGPCAVTASATDDPEEKEEAKVNESPGNIPENVLSFLDAMKSMTDTEAIEDVAGAVLQRLLKTRRPNAESRPKGKSRARPKPPPPADEDVWDLTWLESPKSDTSSPKKKRSKPMD